MVRELIVVTGISGFVGKWVALELLKAGYAVRGTLRDVSKQHQVRSGLAAALGREPSEQLSVAEADLLDDEGWSAAFAGAAAIVHVAAAVMAEEPTDSSLVIKPALDGTKRVLEAAREAGIRRIVMTSSIATIGYGHGHDSGVRIYAESDWTDLDAMRWKWAYCTGKTLAEREAWTFAEANGLDLTTIHPGAIIGPLLDDDASASVELITRMLTGNPPVLPKIGYNLSDVRDVAAMHVAALESPSSIGERYLCTADYLRFAEIGTILKAAYPSAPVPERAIPDWLTKLLTYVVRDVRQIANDIGNEKHYDGSKGRALLGRDYLPAAQTVLDCAESVINVGLVPDPNGDQH